jgi:hypothetical protein
MTAAINKTMNTKHSQRQALSKGKVRAPQAHHLAQADCLKGTACRVGQVSLNHMNSVQKQGKQHCEYCNSNLYLPGFSADMTTRELHKRPAWCLFPISSAHMQGIDACFMLYTGWIVYDAF